MKASTKDKRRSLIAIAGTVVFHVTALLLCLFLGLSVPLPLPEERGVEVNLGNSETGLGTSTAAPKGTEEIASYTNPSSQSSEENYSTQNIEETVALNTKKSNNKNKPQENPHLQEVKPQEPQVNENALFPGKKVTGSENGGGHGTGQGITSGSGDQGKPGGDPNSTNYQGNPGKGGGISFSLHGRSSKSLPKPKYISNEQGSIVVKIWVNKDGTVTKAEAGERGTTIADRSLWRMAEEAAQQSRFTPDDNAPETQIGTITYKFIRAN